MVPTKLPNYILPAYPALAMMAGTFILAPTEPEAPGWRRRIMPVASSFHFLLGSGLLAAAMILLPRAYGPGTSGALIAIAVVVVLLSAAAVMLMLRGFKGAATGVSVATAIVTMAALTLGVIPRLGDLMVSPREAAMVARHIRAGDPPVVLSGYTEPSAVFLLGTQTHLAKGRDAAGIAAGQGGLALIEDGQRSAFLARLAEMEADATAIDAAIRQHRTDVVTLLLDAGVIEVRVADDGSRHGIASFSVTKSPVVPRRPSGTRGFRFRDPRNHELTRGGQRARAA